MTTEKQGKEGMKGEGLTKLQRAFSRAVVDYNGREKTLGVWMTKKDWETAVKEIAALEAKPDSANASLDRLGKKVEEHYEFTKRLGGKDFESKGMNYWNSKRESLQFVLNLINAEKAAQKGEVAER